MEQLLKDISKLSVSIGEAIASEAQIKDNWLGFEPASEEQIKATEERLGLKLPEDYINFLKITNGFSAPNQIEPSFIPVQEITFLRDSDPFLIEAYRLEELERAIFISGEDEEQHFFLIYPKSENEKWRYWKFANWYPGEHEFEDIESYFKNALEFIKEDMEN
jgi:hypothetical protein